LLYEKGKQKEAILVLDTLLKKVKNNPESWSQAVNYQLQERNTGKALVILDSAVKYLPQDTMIINLRKKIDYMIKRAPQEGIYSNAIKAFSAAKYQECLALLNEFISKQTGLAEAYQMRAYCFYYAKQFDRSLEDINKYFSMGEMNYYLLNLRGIDLRALGRIDEACQDFKTAMDNGNPDGSANYNKYCVKK